MRRSHQDIGKSILLLITESLYNCTCVDDMICSLTLSDGAQSIVAMVGTQNNEV
jgi:hypothetical protein